MGRYTFHYIDNGNVRKTEERNIPDDLDAIDLAEKLCAESDIIVWEAYRWIAHIKKNRMPMNVDEMIDEHSRRNQPRAPEGG